MTRRVAVVIVTHDTRDEALACLSAVEAAGASEIVVVDCGSTDGTVEAVVDEHPGVTVVPLANVGYGRGANAGVARTTAPYVLVANADTRVGPDSLEHLAAAMEDPAVGVAGPRVTYPDGRPQASARRLPTAWQAFMHALLGLWWPSNRWTRAYREVDADPMVARDVDWVSGCALMLRRSAFEELGGFDPGYWMYVEDVDLGYRLRRAGWRLRYVPDALVVHAVGSSTGDDPRMVVAHARSLDRFHRRAYGDGMGQLSRPFVKVGLGLWVLLKLAWQRLVGRRTDRSSTGE